MNGSAQLDGQYRYSLTRQWSSGPRVCWIMLNPSTADADQDDPTIRRCIGFSRTWGFGELVIVNLFALRATNPRELKRHVDPVGAGNEREIGMASRTSALTVAAWGVHGAFLQGGARARARLGSRICHLGLTRDGHPRHPLYLRGDTRPVRWESGTQTMYARLPCDGPVEG